MDWQPVDWVQLAISEAALVTGLDRGLNARYANLLIPFFVTQEDEDEANGVDVNVTARLRDVTIQGGTSTGNVVEDECGVVTQHPEMYIFTGWGGTLDFFKQFNPSLGQWPQAFCRRESG